MRLESALQAFTEAMPAAPGVAGPRTPLDADDRAITVLGRRIPMLATIDDLAYERARLAALDRYRVLDTEPEKDFEEIVELAAHVCGTTMALVSLIDADRQWFKARMGVDVCSTDREVAFCDHAVRARAALVVPDATQDPRFVDNPFVTGEAHIRFYAGAPLVTPEGYVLGTLCVLDTEPRDLPDHQLKLLTSLAHQAMTQLERRRQAEALAEEVARHEVARDELTRRKRFDEAVMESVSTGVLACDENGEIVLYNAAQRRLTGMGSTEPFDGNIHAAPSDAYAAQLRRISYADGTSLADGQTPLGLAFAGQEMTDVPMRVEQADGTVRHVLVTARRILSKQGDTLGAVAAFADITAERAVQEQLRESAAFHDAVLAASPDVIYTSDPRNNTTLWTSRNLTDILGYQSEDVIALGASLLDTLVHPDDVPRLRDGNASIRELADGGVILQRFRARHVDGSYRWLSRRVTPFARDEDGAVIQMLGVARDVTDIVEMEDRLREAALHDPLTGLPNRTLLGDRLTNALARCRRTSCEVAVLFCDLDGFKQVNDTGGHAAGDHVLRVTADRLREMLRTQDTVARLGGDEFVIVLEPGPKREGEDAPFDVREAAFAVAERVKAEVARPIDIDGHAYSITASIGITFADDSGDPGETLRDADTAMYRAKSAGKNRAELFG